MYKRQAQLKYEKDSLHGRNLIASGSKNQESIDQIRKIKESNLTQDRLKKVENLARARWVC